MKAATNMARCRRRPSWGCSAALYFSQGLPFGFFTQALPVLLREQGFSLGQIGLSSLLVVPWALKFLWAPARRSLVVARVGRRKSWIVPLQLGAVVVLALLAPSAAPHSMPALMAAILLAEPARRDPGHRDRRARGRHARARGARPRQRPAGGRLPGRHDRRRRRAAHAPRSPRLGADVPGHGRADRARDACRSPPRASPLATPAAAARSRAARISSAARARRACCCCWSPTRPARRSRPACCARSSPTRASALEDIGWLLGTVGFVAGLLGALRGRRARESRSGGSSVAHRCSGCCRRSRSPDTRTWRWASRALRRSTSCLPPSTSRAAWRPPRCSPA